MARYIQDAALTIVTALPAAAANNNSATLDLGSTRAADYEGFEIEVDLPATPSLADAHTVTLQLQHSSDNITFANIPELEPLVATGAGGVGSAAVKQRVRLPSQTKRYIQLNQAVASGGGNNTAISSTMYLMK